MCNLANFPDDILTNAYKSRVYSQGQKWDDGCDFRCECIDAVRGRYKCDYRYDVILFYNFLLVQETGVPGENNRHAASH
jgi:hypothetical protein